MSLMLAEIQQQPAVLERTIKREGRRIARFADSLKRRRTRLIVLVARGSSDNAALFGRYLLEISTGIPVSLAAPAVHTLYRSRLDLADALVIGISQSGEGTDINMVLENSRRGGATGSWPGLSSCRAPWPGLVFCLTCPFCRPPRAGLAE